MELFDCGFGVWFYDCAKDAQTWYKSVLIKVVDPSADELVNDKSKFTFNKET